MTPSPLPSDPWGLAPLRQEWARRRAAVLAAKATIDITGMTRPPRDPVERAWLDAHGLQGPFQECDDDACHVSQRRGGAKFYDGHTGA